MIVATAIRLNIGAGDDRREGDGWLNVDLRPDVADVVAAADELGLWGDGSVAEIQALDILEHFWRDDVACVLAEWHRVLQPGGLLVVRVPNLHMLAVQLTTSVHVSEDNPSSDIGRLADDRIANTIENIYGGHRWGPTHAPGSWDTHHWGYTPKTFEELLAANGFAVLSNDERHNMTVKAMRK